MDPQTPAQPIPSQPQPTHGLISPSNIYQGQNSNNLVHSVKVMDIGAPRTDWKLIVLDVFAVIIAAMFGYSFMRYLAGTASFWFVAAALLLWTTISVLEGFLQKNISRRLLVLLLESLAVLASFYTFAWQALVIALIAVVACLMWGYFSVRRELRNTIEVRFFTASGKVIGKVITAAIVFMVVMYASLANNNGNFFVSKNSFNTFFDWAAGFVNNFYPTLPFNSSFGSFADAVAQMQLKDNPAFQSLTLDEQNATLAQSADQLASAFAVAPAASSTTSLPATATATSTSPAVSAVLAEPTSNAFYNYLATLTAQLQAKFGAAFVGIWGLILFLALRSIGIIVVWIAQFVSLIFYEILLATGFMKIKEQPATKEIIEI